MEMHHCPECGEDYSASYRSCPFCEEERSYRGLPRKNRKKKPNPLAGKGRWLMAILLLFFVISLTGKLFGGVIPPKTEQTETATLVLSQQELTFDGLTEPIVLVASEGRGSYTWSSSDEAVATVSEDGTVTPVGQGTCTITCSDKQSEAVCTVQVSATSDIPQESQNLSMNRSDITLKRGESFRLQVSGTTQTVTWSSDNQNVVSVGTDGTVSGVGSGHTTVTATVAGQQLTCVVRVK